MGQAKAQEPSARQKALEFAKNVPKPEPKRVPVPESSEGRERGREASSGRPLSDLEVLEEQHRQDQARIDAIRQELGRMGL